MYCAYYSNLGFSAPTKLGDFGWFRINFLKIPKIRRYASSRE